MASIYQDAASGMFRISFRFGNPPRQFHKSLETTDPRTAESDKGRIEGTLTAINKGWLQVPPGADFWQFVYSGGKLEEKPAVEEVVTLKKLFARYQEEMPHGAMEKNSLATVGLHLKHLARIFGEKQAAQALTTADLQRYVNQRAQERFRGKLIKATTIRKEVASFRAVWNWGVSHHLLTGPAPTKGLKYEKRDEKLPFMTWKEIEQRIGRGGLSEDEINELWDCLFLDTREIEELLSFVKAQAAHPLVYPMFVFAAHTGARRSEICRSLVTDFDFKSGQVCLREKKRDRTVKFTFRHVPMTPLLREVMETWFQNDHPGGPFAFCLGDLVARSRKRSPTTGHKGEKTRATTLTGRLADVRERTELPGQKPLTKNEATHHFKHPLQGSKWEKLRGFHVLRHSFATNCAANGANQSMINRWMGHQTIEMQNRYQHRFPDREQEAIKKVFN